MPPNIDAMAVASVVEVKTEENVSIEDVSGVFKEDTCFSSTTGTQTAVSSLINVDSVSTQTRPLQLLTIQKFENDDGLYYY